MSDQEDYFEDMPDGQIENGHLPSESPPRSSPESEAGSDLDAEDQFDIELPTSHRYLGKLDNVSGYTMYEDGEIVTLMAMQTNTLVFPGFTLPLVLNNDIEISLLQRHTEKKAFVLLVPNKSFQGVFQYGVIMEIFETHMRDTVLHLKARSRQRCQIMPGKPKNLYGEIHQVTVKALLEPPITSPIGNTGLLALKSKRKYTCEDHADFAKCKPYRKYHLVQYPLASWVYDKHEVSFLKDRLLKGLAKYYEVQYLPEDPVKLTYWFVQNFQLKHEERLAIMAMNSAMERLRLELKLLHTKRLICCASCQAEIARHSHVFPMSKDGVQSNYCNPNGNVYETVTVSKVIVQNVNLVGRPSPQFSWFPGYSWTIIQCQICSSHLGWKFSSANLKPKHFFGLAKSGLDVKIVDEERNSL